MIFSRNLDQKKPVPSSPVSCYGDPNCRRNSRRDTACAAARCGASVILRLHQPPPPITPDSSRTFCQSLAPTPALKYEVVARGTGQAIRLARNGDADVLLVHHRASEEQFVAGGFGLERRDVMYNDFVILGPLDDPAGIRAMHNATSALSAIARVKALFISRGDDSGTHKAERRLWSNCRCRPPGGDRILVS